MCWLFMLMVRFLVSSQLLVKFWGSQKLYCIFSTMRGTGASTSRVFWGCLIVVPVGPPTAVSPNCTSSSITALKGTDVCLLPRRQGWAAFLLPASCLSQNSLFQVSVLGCPDPVVHEIAYQYGKNVGIAFQVGLFFYRPWPIRTVGRVAVTLGWWCSWHSFVTFIS